MVSVSLLLSLAPSVNGVQSNFHCFASETVTEISAVASGVSGTVASGALSHRVRRLAMWRVPSGETMWRDDRAGEKAGEASQLW